MGGSCKNRRILGIIMKNQYWLKVEYEDGFERWELTRGKFATESAARKAYEARGKAMHFTITEVKAHEQFELDI